MNPTVAPMNIFPEQNRNVFERSMAPSIPGNRGPLRFEEGIATDTDVPNDFGRGAYFDTAPSRFSPNQACTETESVFKRANETMRERAHVGSASWVEAPEVLQEFVQGSMAGDGMPMFDITYNSGYIMKRPSAAAVMD